MSKAGLGKETVGDLHYPTSRQRSPPEPFRRIRGEERTARTWALTKRSPDL